MDWRALYEAEEGRLGASAAGAFFPDPCGTWPLPEVACVGDAPDHQA